MTKKMETFYLSLLVSLWVLLAALFAYTDLEFSISLYDSSAKWADWLHRLGEFPGIIIAYIAVLKIFSHGIGRLSVNGYGIVGAIGLIVINLYLPQRLYYYFGQGGGLSLQNWVLSFLIGISIAYGAVLMEMKGPQEGEEADKALLVLAAYLFVVVVIQLIKMKWGRIRFLHLGPEYEGYTPWYIINGGEGRSFPSGHTSQAACSMFFIYFIPEYKKGIGALYVAISSLYTLFVAYSRVVYGVHYFSDVLFGMGITLLIVYVTGKIWRWAQIKWLTKKEKESIINST